MLPVLPARDQPRAGRALQASHRRPSRGSQGLQNVALPPARVDVHLVARRETAIDGGWSGRDGPVEVDDLGALRSIGVEVVLDVLQGVAVAHRIQSAFGRVMLPPRLRYRGGGVGRCRGHEQGGEDSGEYGYHRDDGG